MAGSEEFDDVNDVPPHSPDVEVAVLGAMMRSEAAADRASVRGFLKPEHFYIPTHRKVYQAMCDIGDRDEPIDLVTVCAELERKGILAQCGGRAAMVDIADSVFTAANAEAHGRIVLEKSILRQLITLGNHVSDKSRESPGDITEFVEEVQSRVTDITLNSQAGMRGITKVAGLASKALQVIERAQSGEQVGICGTGITTLDKKIRALREQDLVVIAARPSMGKTSLVCDILLHAARQGVPCALFSVESGDVPIVIRMACSIAKVSLVKAMNGGLGSDDMVSVSNAIAEIYELPIWIDRSEQLSNVMFAARAQKLVRGYGIKVIGIDYIQQMDGPAKSENKHHEVTAIIQTIKRVALQLDVCCIALSQMNREADKGQNRSNKELSNMRDSGKIEEAADIVIFPEIDWPDENTSEEQMPATLEAKLRVKKHRNGPKGLCPCLYLPTSLTFVNKDWTHADQRKT